MSRSVIACRDCKAPIAHRLRSGHIHVAETVRAVYLPDGSLELRCRCGARRLIRRDDRKAA